MPQIINQNMFFDRKKGRSMINCATHINSSLIHFFQRKNPAMFLPLPQTPHMTWGYLP